jgi:hypothetical protein
MLSTAMMSFLNESKTVQSITIGHAEDETRQCSKISLKRLKFVNNFKIHFQQLFHTQHWFLTTGLKYISGQ